MNPVKKWDQDVTLAKPCEVKTTTTFIVCHMIDDIFHYKCDGFFVFPTILLVDKDFDRSCSLTLC